MLRQEIKDNIEERKEKFGKTNNDIIVIRQSEERTETAKGFKVDYKEEKINLTKKINETAKVIKIEQANELINEIEKAVINY